MFEGLERALYDAREHLDLSNVQPRGEWGTPTQKALPLALKTSIQRAIAAWAEESRR